MQIFAKTSSAEEQKVGRSRLAKALRLLKDEHAVGIGVLLSGLDVASLLQEHA
eukprot:COSAG02_NODE_4130_length_5740_cov_3.273888_2_plen_53_part_00